MIYLSFRFPHHGKYSSYHRLVEYRGRLDDLVDATICWAICYNKILNWRGLTSKFWRKIKERRAWRLARSKKEKWIHYLYPEQGYFLGNSFRQEGQKILFSCHLPENLVEVGRSQLSAFIDGLKNVDGVILMSPEDRDYYARLAPKARIAFIPHGVDIDRFKPASMKVPDSEILRVITVGNMARDFDRLSEVISDAAAMSAPLQFQVVAFKHNLKELERKVGPQGWQIVQPLTGISDNELLKLYQQSDILFLPLLAATANNAVLEAMATGLPLFLSDLPGCRAYAKECGSYFPSNASSRQLVIQLLEFSRDRGKLKLSGDAARELAVRELSWEVVIKRQTAFMRAIEEDCDFNDYI